MCNIADKHSKMQTTQDPALSVVMSVYNAEKTLPQALDSILSQTFSDFEFLVVDDCSEDSSPRILAHYAAQDNRLHVIHNKKNIRLAASLNKGVALARSPLIARMDADDVALPERFAKQIAFLKSHPHVDVCGTAYQVPETGHIWYNAENDEMIRVRMLFACEIVHPSIIIKKKTLEKMGGYPVVTPCEDYTLWTRMCLDKSRPVFANLPDVLMQYSWANYLQGTTSYMQATDEVTWRNRRLLLHEGLGITLTENDVYCHRVLCGCVDTQQFTQDKWNAVRDWCARLLQANMETALYDQKCLEQELARRFPMKEATIHEQFTSDGASAVGSVLPENTCPLCKTTDTQRLEILNAEDIIRLYRDEHAYDIRLLLKAQKTIEYRRCRNCDLRFFTPQLFGDEQFYAYLAARYVWYYLDNKWEYEVVKKYIPKNVNILEIGCGKGAFCTDLQCISYTGLEISPGQLPQSGPGYTFLPQSSEEHAVTHKSAYDVICSFQVVEHIVELKEFFDAIMHMLKPGGLLLFTVPSEDTYQNTVVNSTLNMPPHHMTRWTDAALQSVAKLYQLEWLGLLKEPLEDRNMVATHLITAILRTAAGLSPSPLIDTSAAHGELVRTAQAMLPLCPHVVTAITAGQTSGTVLSVYRKPEDLSSTQNAAESAASVCKIAILYICTGRYALFWEDFYQSCEAHFLPRHEKDYFVFTDGDISHTDNPRVHRIEQPQLAWPYATLHRFHMFESIIDNLQSFDFIFFFNANCEFIQNIDETILPDALEGLVMVQHPGFFDKPRNMFTYETNPQSAACIPDECGAVYVMGAMNGGRAQEYVTLIQTLRAAIDADSTKGIIAVWHDESHLNRYILDHPYKLLNPGYLTPEGIPLPFPEKIRLRDKNSLGGHAYLRGQIDIPSLPVIARLTCGLGNQMFQLAAAVAVAARFQGTVELDTSWFALSGDHAPREFSLHRAFPSTQMFCETTEQTVEQVPHVQYFDLSYPADFEQVCSPVLLDGYWQSEQYFRHCAQAIRHFFTFAEFATPEARALAERIVLTPDATAVHVRRGDYVSLRNVRDKHGLLGPAYYQQAITELQARIAQPHLFIFSDEPQWAVENFDPAGLPAEVVAVTPPDSPWDDMHLMSLCNHHIIANSSFSWWGAWLAANLGHVFAPKAWFSGERADTSSLFPEGWHTVAMDE